MSRRKGNYGWRSSRRAPQLEGARESQLGSVKVPLIRCAHDHGIDGKTSLAISISPFGTVDSVRTDPTNVDLEECAMRVVTKLGFPQSQVGVLARYPVVVR